MDGCFKRIVVLLWCRCHVVVLSLRGDEGWPLCATVLIDVTVPWSVSVCLSVCHVRALCWNGRRCRHDFFCITKPNVSPRSREIWLTSVNPFLPKFCLKVTHSDLDVNVWDIRRQIATEWLEVTIWRAYRKPLSLFRMVPSLTFYNLHFPEMGVPNVPQNQLRDACCHLANMIEDIDNISFA